MKKLALFFALASQVTGCGEQVVKPQLPGLTDGVSRLQQGTSFKGVRSVVSFDGTAFEVPASVGLIDINGKSVCDASGMVLGELLGVPVSCNAGSLLWFDTGRNVTGPEVFTGFLKTLRSTGHTVSVTSEGVVISGDGEDAASVVTGGPVDAPGVDFLGDGTSLRTGAGLDAVSRTFGELTRVTDGGGVVESVPYLAGLLDTAEAIIRDRSLDVSAVESESRLYLIGPRAQVSFVKAALRPEDKHSVTLVTGPLTDDSVSALSTSHPEFVISHDASKGLLYVTGFGDDLEASLPSFRRFVSEPRQVRLEGVFAEFTQRKSLDAGLSIEAETGSFSGGFGASIEGSSITFKGDVSATLSLLQEVGDVSVLARPSLTILDGQTGRFVSGDQVPVLGETVSDEAGRVTQSIEYRDTGIVLDAHAIVLDDATVQVRVTIEVTSVSETTGVGDNPVFSTRTVNTTLRVTNGQSVVISGLNRDQNSIGSSGFPGLSKIGLFGKRTSSRSNSELIFVVTPDVMGSSGALMRDTGAF